MADGSTSSPQAELDSAIQQNSEGPKRASADPGSVEQHPLADQIAADRYLNSKKAVRGGLAVTLTKIVLTRA